MSTRDESDDSNASPKRAVPRQPRLGDAASARPDPPPQNGAGSTAATPKVIVVGVTVLAVLAVLYTLYFARAFLLPLAFAVLLSFFLSPLIRALGKLHIAAPAAAALLVLSFIGVTGVAIYALAGPVQEWVAHAPETMHKAGARLRILSRPVDQVTKAADQVERATTVEAPAKVPQVVVQGPTLAARFFGTTQALVQGAIEVVVLLYFLLAAGDFFLEKLVKVLPQLGDKRKAVSIARAIESSISTYLLTTAAINVGEGAVVALAMRALGMPTPYVWGAMVACLEFIPYVGMAVAVAVVTVAGLTTFSSLSHALAAPGILIAINFVQGNVVSPLVMSRRLTLNPVALFVGLAFWWWVWGIAGALLAVPLLAAFKILCDHVTALSPVGEFLGGRDPTERRTWVGSRDAGRLPIAQSSLISKSAVLE
jgi:predicted PurR-regulated permease PerM